jgi:hypothetical protein
MPKMAPFVGRHRWSLLVTLTDQPGRWFAVLCFAPYLWWRGHVHRDPSLMGLAVLLFVWDSVWLAIAAPRCMKE